MSSFEGFAIREADWLLRCAYLLTGGHAAAEDLTQDTRVRVFRGWTKVEGARNPRAYVARVMLNQHRNSLRKEQRFVQPLSLSNEAYADERLALG